MQILESKIKNKEILTEEEIQSFLKNLVRLVRLSINDESMINKCDAVQGLVCRYLEKLDVETHPCSTLRQISNYVVGHNFTVIKLNEDYYIIDPSFVQFMYDLKQDIYIKNIRCISYSPYVYGVNLNTNYADYLTENGYIKLDYFTSWWYGNMFYQTLTNIPQGYQIPFLDGRNLLLNFLKGNEKLTKYDYEELDTIIESINKR